MSLSEPQFPQILGKMFIMASGECLSASPPKQYSPEKAI